MSAAGAQPPLLVVEEAFVTRGSGVMVMPRITFDGTTHAPFAITLRLPSGQERKAQGVFEVAHIKGAFAPFAMLRVLELKPDDVPAGTIITRDA